MKAKAKVKAQAKAKAKANSLASEARSAEKILLLQPWRAQRKEKFCNARLGHPFSLVSGNAGTTLGSADANYPSVTEIRYWRFLGVPPNVTFLIPA